MKHKYYPTAITATCLLVILTLTLSACVSRYDLDLMLKRGELHREVTVERTEFVRDGVLNLPTAREKVTPGTGNCIIVHTGTRGETIGANTDDFLQWDKHLKYDIFLQLGSRVETSTVQLPNNSYVLLVGEFDLPLENRVFSALAGSLVIDSIPSKYLYATIDGTYVNRVDDSVVFDGSFRVRVKD